MIEEQFKQAMALHSQGQVDDAIALYQRILEADPNHAGAIHLMGVAASQKGQFQLAVQFIQAAIVLNASVPEFHINLGNALMGMGEGGAAGKAYEQALALNSGIPEAWFGLGNALAAVDKIQDGVEAYRKALALRPEFVEAMVNMGRLLIALKRLDEAVEVLGVAATLRPNDAQPRYLLALALEVSGHPEEAATLYVTLADLPHCPVSLLFDVGKRLAALEQHHAAFAIYKAALLLAPNEMVLWNNLGNSLRSLDHLNEAKISYTKASALAPEDGVVLSNLGTVLKDLGEFPEAVDTLRRAVDLGGGMMAHSNLGHAFYLQGNFEEAAACFENALKVVPGDPDATFHLGVVNLLTGKWADGWRQYESRWLRRQGQEPQRHQEHPQWDGSTLTGKTILLWSEQGLGDTLQFIRFADQLVEQGATVVVECQPALVALLGQMPSIERVVAVGGPVPDFDVHAPLLSLPHLLGLTLETLPQAGPYLASTQDQSAFWQDKLGPDSPKVGLVWSGESLRLDVECVLIDRRRSVPLKALAPLLAVQGVQFVSLQLGPARSQLTEWEQILDPADHIKDFADTAALVAQLDLVISVDTSVAHLAAAMGKPVWLLSRFDGCWRWLRGRTDSPWYPSMTLYAQSAPGEWGEPVAALARDMARWLE